MSLYQDICSIVGTENVLVKEPMSKHTTFRVGGPADYFLTPDTPGKVKDLVFMLQRRAVPYYIIGNGSNLLVSDKGYRGVIIQITSKLSEIEVHGTKIQAKAGAMLSKVAAIAQRAGLTGMEFASGIPGTLGGAVTMNAGAYGGEMKDIVKGCLVLSPEGEFQAVPVTQLGLGYRTSNIARNGSIIFSVELQLQEGDPAEIAARMEELKRQRIEKQPLEFPSAGSTFKRPEGYFAGKLIQDSGLKGYSIGGAQVSEKHAGFIINTGDATASDIRNLILHVQNTVKEDSGVILQPEVKMVGVF